MARNPFAVRKLAVGGGIVALLAFGVQAGLSARNVAQQSSVIVSGTIVDAAQQPIASLQVVLNLTPVGAAGTVSGRSLSIGGARTDAAGHFAIKAEVTAQLRKLASINDGWLNFDLLAFNSTLALYRSVPRQLVTAGWVGPPETNGSTDLGTLGFAPGQPGVGSTKRRSVAVVALCADSNSTLTTATRLTVVGELHNASGTAHFDYGNVADSNISVLVKIGADPWSESAGDVHIGNTLASVATRSASVPTHVRLRSYFLYAKIQTTNPCTGTRLTVKATKWTSPKLVSTAIADPSGGCTAAPWSSHVQTFGAGGSFTRSANPAWRWSPAVDLTAFGPPASVIPTARSGYSLHVKATWQFPGGGKLCGNDAAPSSSKRIAAGG